MKRISPRGLQFEIWEIDDNQVGVSLIGTEKKIILNIGWTVFSAAWFKWQMQHAHVQNAFPMLSPDEREFLLTGTTAQEWEDMFPPDME